MTVVDSVADSDEQINAPVSLAFSERLSAANLHPAILAGLYCRSSSMTKTKTLSSFQTVSKVSFALTLLFFAFCFSNAKAQTTAENDKTPVVSVCDLDKPQTKFHKQIVKVSGTFLSNFEHVSLVDKSCVIGVEFENSAVLNDLDKRSKKLMKGNSFDGEWVGATFIGEIKVVDKTEASRNQPKVIIHVFEIVKLFKAEEPK